MRKARFHGLRARLSYANVMATLALFFALTGAATAATGAVPFLSANQAIPATSDLTGTYGNPAIGNGKIKTANFASAAVAPDAAKLGGHAAAEFPRIIKAGTFDVLPGAGIPSQTCSGQGVAQGDDLAGVDPSTDYIVIQPGDGVDSFATVSGRFDTLNPAPNVEFLSFFASWCNASNFGPQDISGTYHYLILR